MMVFSNVVKYHHRGRALSNNFYLTPVELACFMADSILDDDGNVVYGSAAAAVVQTAIKRAQRTSTRQERHNLKDPETLAKYKAMLVEILDKSNRLIAEGRGGLLPAYYISKFLLKLGKNAIYDTPELNKLYKTYQQANSNATPATLNNDPDDYLDFEN